MSIINPILKGFNPDPSITKKDDTYYIATSTFDWMPGVQIHESKGLVNWELIGHPIDDLRLLDMRGNLDSGVKSDPDWIPVRIENKVAVETLSLNINEVTINIKDGFNKKTLEDILDVIRKVC